jgi:hypothetical protein
MAYKSIHEIIAATKSSPYSQNWFSAGSVTFFDSKIELGGRVFGGQYFVTSEVDSPNPRRYTIRKCDDEGTISNVGEFQQYASVEDARKVVESL